MLYDSSWLDYDQHKYLLIWLSHDQRRSHPRARGGATAPATGGVVESTSLVLVINDTKLLMSLC
jgi:hypothetical protein